MKQNTVTIHQSQYLPWLPFFAKVLDSDVFVVLDHVQFEKNGVQNRNQVKTASGATWLTVPVKQTLGTPINQTEIANQRILGKHLKTIQQSYAKSAYFDEIFPLLERSLTGSYSTISELNSVLLQMILDYLGWSGELKYSSDMNLESKAHHLVMDICEANNATAYLSGSFGREYLDTEAFSSKGIDLRFQDYTYPTYQQLFPKQEFVSHLSIIDLIFNEGSQSAGIISRGSAYSSL